MLVPCSPSINALKRACIPLGSQKKVSRGVKRAVLSRHENAASTSAPLGLTSRDNSSRKSLPPLTEIFNYRAQPMENRKQQRWPLMCATSGLAVAGMAIASHPACAAVALNAMLDTPADMGGSFQEGFLSSSLLIFLSELGDKTFFVAALTAMRNPKWAVFVGTLSALSSMSFISTGLGLAAHELPFNSDVPVDDYLAAALLLLFGVQSLRDASKLEEDSRSEEEEEATEVADGLGSNSDIFRLILQVFLTVFLAEWGDKSFIATIALGATNEPLGVALGATSGHAVATLLAVGGGAIAAEFISEKVAATSGGILFIVFAVLTVLRMA